MSTTANAYGNALGMSAPFLNYAAIGTPLSTILNAGSRVAAFVRSSGAQDLDDLFVRENLVTTLNEGCKRVRSGLGDVVVCLQGHAETLSGTDPVPDLVAGTRIIGMGRPGANAPLFTWGSTDTSTLLLNVANVELHNLSFAMTGADSLNVGITVTAAGCAITNCQFNLGTGTSNDCDVGVQLGSGADDFLMAGCWAFASGGTPTNWLATAAAITRTKLLGNRAVLPLTSTNGVFQIGNSSNVVSLLEIAGNRVVNTSTGTAGVASFTDVAHTGVVYDNYSGLTADSAPATTGIVLAGTTNILVQFFQNFTNDGEAKGRSGILSPAANDGS